MVRGRRGSVAGSAEVVGRGGGRQGAEESAADCVEVGSTEVDSRGREDEQINPDRATSEQAQGQGGGQGQAGRGQDSEGHGGGRGRVVNENYC